MIPLEFQHQFNRLKKRFKYDEEFSAQLWQKVGRLSVEALAQAVDYIMGNQFQIVGVYSICELAEKYRTKTASSTISFWECIGCNGYGLVMMQHPTLGVSPFACDCHNGRRQHAMAQGKTHGDSGKEFVFLYAGKGLKCGYEVISDETARALLAARSFNQAEPQKQPDFIDKSYANCPWPESLKAIPLMIKQQRTGKAFDVACKLNRINHDEAWRLHELFSEKKFDHPFVFEIIQRSKNKTTTFESFVDATK